MNKRSLKQIVLLICVLSTLCTGCKKKEIQGPKGEPGTPGGGGNASISSSNIFLIASTQWTVNADSSGWLTSINSALITQDVVDKGAVKVYVFRYSSWWELPYTEGDEFTQYGFKTGMVNLTLSDIHGGLPPKPVTTDYRLVILSESGKPAAPYLNYSDDNAGREMSN